MIYNWQNPEWPYFVYNVSELEEKLYSFSKKMGLITGILRSLPGDTQMETIVEVMVAEAIKTSEIEGEFLSRKDVTSSIRNDLGLNPRNDQVIDKRSKGIGQLMIDVVSLTRKNGVKNGCFYGTVCFWVLRKR